MGFNPNAYIFEDGVGPVVLTLEVSGLAVGAILECPVDVNVIYNDGPKASKLRVGLTVANPEGVPWFPWKPPLKVY